MKVYLASKGAIQTQRVLTRTECKTEASVICEEQKVRMWRSGGVLSRGMQKEIRCRTQEALCVPDGS